MNFEQSIEKSKNKKEGEKLLTVGERLENLNNESLEQLGQHYLNKIEETKEESKRQQNETIENFKRQMRGLGRSEEEIDAAVKGILGNFDEMEQGVIESGKQQIETIAAGVPANVEYAEYEVVNENSKIVKHGAETVVAKTNAEGNTVESAEVSKEEPLGIGDEVYKDGIFYKIHDFLPEYNTEIQTDYLNKKNNNQIKPGESRWEWEARRRKELAAEGITPPRKFRALISGGGIGGGKGGLEFFDESQVTRVTPELKKKILEMKKESGRGDDFATR